MQIVHSEKPAFSIFTLDQLDTLEQACRTVEPRLYISEMDYQKGTITLGMHYDNFDQADFIKVNVASDSVAAAFYDVYTRAYDRCI